MREAVAKMSNLASETDAKSAERPHPELTEATNFPTSFFFHYSRKHFPKRLISALHYLEIEITDSGELRHAVSKKQSLANHPSDIPEREI